jgi:hypothetical protein
VSVLFLWCGLPSLHMRRSRIHCGAGFQACTPPVWQAFLSLVGQAFLPVPSPRVGDVLIPPSGLGNPHSQCRPFPPTRSEAFSVDGATLPNVYRGPDGGGEEGQKRVNVTSTSHPPFPHSRLNPGPAGVGGTPEPQPPGGAARAFADATCRNAPAPGRTPPPPAPGSGCAGRIGPAP